MRFLQRASSGALRAEQHLPDIVSAAAGRCRECHKGEALITVPVSCSLRARLQAQRPQPEEEQQASVRGQSR